MLDELRAYPEGFNPPPGWDGKIYKITTGPQIGKEYVWGFAQANWSTAAQMNGDHGAIRVRVPSNATPGDYTLHTTLQTYLDNGATIPVGPLIYFNWPFTAYPPAQFTATPPNTFPPIPTLSTWQNTMVSNSIGGGEYWCSGIAAVVPVASLEYGNFLGPIFDLVGTFNAYSQPDATKAYNYDGGKVYMQIADYNYNTPGMPGYHDPVQKAHYQHCAQMVLYPYENWVTRSLGQKIDEPNQHMLGTGMYYARTQDPTAKSALSYVTDTNGSYTGYYGSLDTKDLRWIFYSWDSQIANEASGVHTPWVLAGAATDIAMANLDEFQQFAVNQGSSFQPEWNYHNYTLGIMMEALIDQCELDKEKLRACDPRIPLEIGKSLYALFNNFYLSDLGVTRYDFIDAPMSHVWNDQNSLDIWSNLDNLIAPAAAWYWAQTGDDTIRQYADNMFAATWNDTSDLTWGAKQFSQVYKWSFDFVYYRSGPNPKATFLPSQNPYEGPWPDTAPPLIFSEYNCGSLNMDFNQGKHRWPQTHQIDGNALCQTSTLPTPVVNGKTVTLTWDTVENATTEVYYTTSVPPVCSYGLGSYDQSVTNCLAEYSGHYSADPNGVRHHSAVVTGLVDNQTYHYILFSKDPSANGAMTPDATFTTQ
jgi:hypothetical protein